MIWIYKLVEMLSSKPGYPLTPTDVEKLLNGLGAEGWELCGIEYDYFILKRQVRNDG